MTAAATPWRSVEELENSASFQALLVAAVGKPERIMGESVIPAEPPHWLDVQRLSKELLSVPPGHASVLVNHLKSEANLSGFRGFQSALADIRDRLESGWDSLYPPSDVDDPEDPFYARINVFRELSDDPVFADSLYRLPLVDVRGIGAYSARDLDIAKGLLNASEEEQARCQDGLVRAAFDQTDPAVLQELADALAACGSMCTDIESIFTLHAGSDNGLSMAALANRINDCQARFLEFAGERLEKSVPTDASATAPSDASGAAGNAVKASAEADTRPVATSVLVDRHAARQTLINLIAYYQRFEPSSPVPELAHRVLEMTTKPFFELLQELAPGCGDNLPRMLSELSKKPVTYLIDDCHRRFLAGTRVPSLIAVESAEPCDAMPPSTQTASTALAVESRSEVLSAIGELEAFFLQTEPASPAPLVLSEMRRLVPKTFVELLADLSRMLPVTESNASSAQTEDSA